MDKKTNIQFITIDLIDISENPEIIHHKKSRKFKTPFDRKKYEEQQITWQLYKHMGKRISPLNFEFFYFMPSDKFNDHITSTYLLEHLNSENLFDFDYQPKEGDNLKINYEYVHPVIPKRVRPPIITGYMSFVFRKGQWISELYNHNTEITEEYKHGILIA